MKSILPIIYILLSFHSKMIAQVHPTVLASDLRSPIGIDRDEAGNFWIAEQGTGTRDGAVSVIWTDGTVQRVIDSLYTVFDSVEQISEGPVRVQVSGEYVYVMGAMAENNAELGIMVFDRNSIIKNGDALSIKDILSTIRVNDAAYREGKAESHAYSMVFDGCDVYIADAAANAIFRKNGESGVIKSFANIPSKHNPLPFGPPFIDAVPTRILINPTGGFYLSELSGFPFIAGNSNIYQISEDGTPTILYDKLTMITDMVPAPDGDGLIALQMADFSLDSLPPLIFNSSKIIQLKPDQSRDTLAIGFGPAAGLALADDGGYVVTLLYFGLVIKLDKKSTSGLVDFGAPTGDKILVFPNPIDQNFYIRIPDKQDGKGEVTIFDVLGRIVYHRIYDLNRNDNQEIELNVSDWHTQKASGAFVIRLDVGKKRFFETLVVK